MSQSPKPLAFVETNAAETTTSEAFLPNPPLETRRARRARLHDVDDDAELDANVIPISPYEERPRLSLVGAGRAMRRPRF